MSNGARRHPASPRAFVRSLWSHRDLIGRLVGREFESRFKGNFLGIVWAVITPLVTALILTFVFSAILRARWGVGESGGASQFVLVLLTGLIVHTVFAETLSRAPGLILYNAGYVTRVVFPLEVLPVVTVLTALINALIGIAIVVTGNLILNGSLSWTALALPLVFAPYLLFVTAVVYFFSALGVYVRDLSQVVTLMVTASLFLTPIFYPIESVPDAFRPFILINPLTVVVEEARALVLFGRWPDYPVLGLYWLMSLLSVSVGFWVFQRLRTGFADVV